MLKKKKKKPWMGPENRSSHYKQDMSESYNMQTQERKRQF